MNCAKPYLREPHTSVNENSLAHIFMHLLFMHQHSMKLCAYAHVMPNSRSVCLASQRQLHKQQQTDSQTPNILLRLQAKERKGGMYDCIQAPSSKISKELQGIMEYTTQCTFIKTSFVKQRMASWQAHLQRISHFLLAGEGVWWRTRESGYEFIDGEVVNLAESPMVLHYRDTGLLDIQQRSIIEWDKLLAQKILLPTPFIQLYDSNGTYCGRYIQ